MKIAPPFEIRVGLIGYVSVGKTTILNALLKDKYSEVSMKRTTAGINLFRISCDQESKNQSKNPKQAASNNKKEDAGAGSGAWTNDEEPQSAESTLREITSDNQTLRDSNVLQQKTFDIELDEPLLDMKKDTKLILVDVPGINEAGASKKYKDYVTDNWHTFDCVIVVLDGRQGVNTDEQVEILKLAKDQCQEVKQVPLIILMNKIDDPDDDEQQVLVEEATEAIRKMFNTTDRNKILQNILSGKAASAKSRNKNLHHGSPVVIPISAIHAYIYRAASTLTLGLFKKKIDKAQRDKIGREAYGRQWKRFTAAQQVQKAYEVIQDKDQYQDGLEASKFDKFLKVLCFYVEGEATQSALIEQQIQVSTGRLSPELDFVAALKSLYDKCLRLGKPVDFVETRFLELQQKSVEDAFAKFTGPNEVHHLAKPMNELFAFSELAKHMGTLQEKKKSQIMDLAKTIVLRQIEVVLTVDQWKQHQMSCYDWTLIVGAMLGRARERFFDEYFGVARILLEKRFHQEANKDEQWLDRLPNGQVWCRKCKQNCSTYNTGVYYCARCATQFVTESADSSPKKCHRCAYNSGYHYNLDSKGYCSRCCTTAQIKREHGDPLKYVVNDGKLVPAKPDEFKEMIHFDVLADSPSDPNHFGHLILLFGDLLEYLEETTVA